MAKISFRLSDEELSRLQKEAAKYGWTISELIRQKLLQASPLTAEVVQRNLAHILEKARATALADSRPEEEIQEKERNLYRLFRELDEVRWQAARLRAKRDELKNKGQRDLALETMVAQAEEREQLLSEALKTAHKDLAALKERQAQYERAIKEKAAQELEDLSREVLNRLFVLVRELALLFRAGLEVQRNMPKASDKAGLLERLERHATSLFQELSTVIEHVKRGRGEACS